MTFTQSLLVPDKKAVAHSSKQTTNSFCHDISEDIDDDVSEGIDEEDIDEDFNRSHNWTSSETLLLISTYKETEKDFT